MSKVDLDAVKNPESCPSRETVGGVSNSSVETTAGPRTTLVVVMICTSVICGVVASARCSDGRSK